MLLLLGLRFRDFYPRSPRGERRIINVLIQWMSYFYPRSPRGERPLDYYNQGKRYEFLSTLPARGATIGFEF